MSTRRKPGPTRIGPILSAPVRRWLYGIAAAVAPVATIYGLVTDQQATLLLNVVGAVLFIMAVGNTPARPDESTEDDGT